LFVHLAAAREIDPIAAVYSLATRCVIPSTSSKGSIVETPRGRKSRQTSGISFRGQVGIKASARAIGQPGSLAIPNVWRNIAMDARYPLLARASRTFAANRSKPAGPRTRTATFNTGFR
jgi:hypothetical protein